MLSSSEKFIRVQQQFKEWTAFEQLCATVELTRKFQSSYRYFLLQLFQANIQQDNDDMFSHTVDHANTPEIVSCLLSKALDKVIFTLQLYLPLVRNELVNAKLLDVYATVLKYLNSNLDDPKKFSYSEPQLLASFQQIFFFIQTNPHLQSLISCIPKLIQIIQANQFHFDDSPKPLSHQPLHRFGSVRPQVQPLMGYGSEGSQHLGACRPLTRHGTDDSGVDLTESSVSNPFSSHHNSYSKHSFVVKTSSSPIPEHSTIDISTHVPLHGVFSAPPPSISSDSRQKNHANYHFSKHHSALPKSDEDEQETERTTDDYRSQTETGKPLGQFYSLRYRNTKSHQDSNNVSQYLGVDAHSTPLRNTFTQPNTGMKDVPRWLKHLRLHKYDFFFSQMTYDEMMNLGKDQMKERRITDGACSKILLHIQKLKERSTMLKQSLLSMEKEPIDLHKLVQQLSEIMMTPIRSNKLELENNSTEDLPKLIMEMLEKVFHQLTPSSPADVCNSLLGIFDRCYKHEAFTDDHRHLLLQWRGRLSNMLQSLGKIEYKTIQSPFVSSNNQRRSSKPPLRPMKTSPGGYYSNSTPVNKHHSEPSTNNNHLNDPNLIRRPNRSPPTLICSTTDDYNDANLQASFTCLASTPQRNNGDYLANNQHQTLVRTASISPYGDIHSQDKNKLCKTFSDPSRIRFSTPPTQINQMQVSTSRPPQVQQQNLFRMISKPYSHQRQFLSRSPPTEATLDISASPIKKCYSDNERVTYYENNNDVTSTSNSSHFNDTDNADDSRHSTSYFNSLCLQMTESAISDSVDPKEELADISNRKSSSNNATDTEQ